MFLATQNDPDGGARLFFLLGVSVWLGRTEWDEYLHQPRCQRANLTMLHRRRVSRSAVYIDETERFGAVPNSRDSIEPSLVLDGDMAGALRHAGHDAAN